MKRIVVTISLIFVCLIGKSQYSKGIVIEPILKTDTTSIGQKIIYPHFKEDEITILKKDVGVMREEKNHLEAELTSMKSPEHLRNIAKDRLGMRAPNGDEIFVVGTEDGSN